MKKFIKMKTLITLCFVITLVAFGIQDAGAAKDNILRIAFDAADTKSMEPGRTFGTQDMAVQDMIYNDNRPS